MGMEPGVTSMTSALEHARMSMFKAILANGKTLGAYFT